MDVGTKVTLVFLAALAVGGLAWGVWSRFIGVVEPDPTASSGPGLDGMGNEVPVHRHDDGPHA